MRRLQLLWGGITRRRMALLALCLALTGIVAAEAAFRTRGAGGCGQFLDAVNNAVDGDVILNMFDGGDGRNSEGGIVQDDLIIEGGWSPPISNCPVENGSIETRAELFSDGFSYAGPSSRAALFNPTTSDPVMGVDAQVKSLQVYAHDFYVAQGQTVDGGGVYAGSLTGATLRFTQVGFVGRPGELDDTGTVSGSGGGLYLDVDGGSRVTLDEVQFERLRAARGGGFQLVVRGGSHVTISSARVISGTATAGNGGGGRIIMHSGYVTITGSLFQGNSASGSGGALRIERASGSSGPAEVWIINSDFVGNTAGAAPNISVSGNVVVHQLSQRVRAPLVQSGLSPSVRIEQIVRSGDGYSVAFVVSGFTPSMSGRHVHFFFDSVPPSQAGVPGSGPWYMYAGGSPFTAWGVEDRPPGATRLCSLVANGDHSVIQGTGNCVRLP